MGNLQKRKDSNMAEDRRNEDNGQGDVKNPDTDRRLKENGGGNQGQGQVKDPEHDRRLKENR